MADKRPPLIGITCATVETSQQPTRLCQNQSYLDAVVRAGAAPLLIPHLTSEGLLRAVYRVLDGLLLPGGGDVDPARFGEARHDKCGVACHERDETELNLARWAVDDGKPLLAICRGIQVLNVALGGSLYQDIEAQAPGANKHDWHPDHPRDYLAHTVAVRPQTLLAHVVSVATLPVNSMHHQAIKEVAPRLIVTARAPDQIIEAVEAMGHPFALGVQWHPEELATGDVRAQRLFDAFVEASQA